MEVKVEKVIGKQGDGVWGNVHEFWPDDEQRQLTRGKLIVVCELLIDEEMVPAEVGKELLIRVNELYFGSEEPVREALEQTDRTVKEEFGDVEIAMAVVLEEKIYLFGENNFIEVGEKIGQSTGFVVGKVAPGLKVFLGTKKFWASLPLGLLRSNDVEALVVELHKNQGGVGAILQFPIANSQFPINEEKEINIQDPIINNQGDTVQKIQQKPWKEKLKELVPMRSIYVNEVKPVGYKKIVLTGVAFLAIFLVVFVAGRVKNRQQAAKNDVGVQQVEELIQRYNEGKSLVVLNRDQSRQILEQVQVDVGKLNTKQMEDERIRAMQLDIGDVLGAATGVKKVELRQVVNIALAREGAMASRLVSDDKGQLLVLDSGAGRVFGVNPQSEAVKVLVGKEMIGDAKLISSYPGKYAVLADKGIVECKAASAECSVKVERNEEMNGVVDIKMWAGNIYTLDGGGVWKYTATDTGYGPRQKWLTETEESLSLGLSMVIDGSVWVATSGNVLKYTAGVKDVFEITGFDDGFGGELDVYTDENLDTIYVLERARKRVVVIKKTGEYIEQWTNEQLGQASDIVVDASSKKVYFPVGPGIMVYEGN